MLPWEAPDCIGSTVSAPLGSTSSPLVYPTRENPYCIGSERGALLHRALTPLDLSLSGNGVGHSATRRPTPAHGTNPVSLWETDKLSDGNGV